MTQTLLKDRDSRGQPPLVALHEPEPLKSYLSRVWVMRAFIVEFQRSNIRAQHERTFLGVFWMVLNPLIYSGIYYLLFGVIFDGRRGMANFAAFLIAGRFTYELTHRSVSLASTSLRSNSSLIKTLSFPRATLPISTTLGTVFNFVPGLAIIYLTALATKTPVSWSWIMVIPAALVLTVFNLGLVLIVARVSFHIPDVQTLVPHAMRILMYMSGVVFPTEQLVAHAGKWGIRLFEANPIHLYLRMVRDALLEGYVNPSTWLWGILYAIGFLVFGVWFFRQSESKYGDV